jgi:hypothetical protein
MRLNLEVGMTEFSGVSGRPTPERAAARRRSCSAATNYMLAATQCICVGKNTLGIESMRILR